MTTLLEVNPVNDVIYAFSGNGSYVFELPGSQVPKATTEDPIADSTVKGTVDADGAGAITECFFEWGTSTEYGEANLPCSPGPPLWRERIGDGGPAGDERGDLPLPGRRQKRQRRRDRKRARQDDHAPLRAVPENGSSDATSRGRRRTFTHRSRATAKRPNTTSSGVPNESYGTKSNGGFVSAGSPAGHKDLEFEATGLTAGKTYHYPDRRQERRRRKQSRRPDLHDPAARRGTSPPKRRPG